MKTKALRITCMTAALLCPVTFAMRGASEPAASQDRRSPGLTAKITLADGTSRNIRLEGVGCSVSICSRTVIKGKSGGESLIGTRLDSIAAIRDTTAGQALLVLKDGTERRLSLVTDFRVLYVADRLSVERLDLAKVKSVEFLAP